MATKKKQSETRDSLPRTFRDRPFYGYQLDEEQLAMADAIVNPDIDIVFVNARAGTGKTTIAAGAADILVQHGAYDSIIYIMSPYGERNQGFLPGDITEKSSVYFDAFYRALVNCNINIQTAINNGTLSNQKNGTGYITCITDTFIRGDTFDNAVVIIDEAQNYTLFQLKKALTRVGKNTKTIVIGHDLQCDLADPSNSGFTRYIEHFRDMDRAAVCNLTTNYRGWVSAHADLLA